jgi:hypothetical protein
MRTVPGGGSGRKHPGCRRCPLRRRSARGLGGSSRRWAERLPRCRLLDGVQERVPARGGHGRGGTEIRIPAPTPRVGSRRAAAASPARATAAAGWRVLGRERGLLAQSEPRQNRGRQDRDNHPRENPAGVINEPSPPGNWILNRDAGPSASSTFWSVDWRAGSGRSVDDEPAIEGGRPTSKR